MSKHEKYKNIINDLHCVYVGSYPTFSITVLHKVFRILMQIE
uniref:Uncharacterized protein n=1 Tax=Rhizophora mucronata TaxID=61149 RepID=A0A2P2PZA6_RHIMU